MIDLFKKEKMFMTKGSNFISNFIENVNVPKFSYFLLK